MSSSDQRRYLFVWSRKFELSHVREPIIVIYFSYSIFLFFSKWTNHKSFARVCSVLGAPILKKSVDESFLRAPDNFCFHLICFQKFANKLSIGWYLIIFFHMCSYCFLQNCSIRYTCVPQLSVGWWCYWKMIPML